MTEQRATYQIEKVEESQYDPERAIKLVTSGLNSVHSKRAYERALQEFFAWLEQIGAPSISKAVVQEYKQHLAEKGGSPASINLKISAIRKLAQEAADNGLVDQVIANGISNVKGVTSGGVRAGNWLTKQQAQELLTAPDIATLKGIRDRAILAVLVGSGLRRAEAANLTFEHIQQRDGRWVIVDIVGKRSKSRSIPIPSWVKVAVNEWAEAAGLESGLVFHAVHKGSFVAHKGVTSQAIHDVVKLYGEVIGMPTLAPHDLRRTFAKLAHKGGAAIDQIQESLGHGKIDTTQKYLGTRQSFTDAPADHLGLEL